jgi:hypothetical protein
MYRRRKLRWPDHFVCKQTLDPRALRDVYHAKNISAAL